MKELKIKAWFVLAHIVLPPLSVIFTVGYAIKGGFLGLVNEAKSAWSDCWGDVRDFQKEGFSEYRRRWVNSEKKDETVVQEEA